jgi:hypothetical protein
MLPCLYNPVFNSEITFLAHSVNRGGIFSGDLFTPSVTIGGTSCRGSARCAGTFLIERVGVDRAERGGGADALIHGCFWHRHEGCSLARSPKTRLDYWEPKLASNVARDLRVAEALQSAGWARVIIWECQTRDRSVLKQFALGLKQRTMEGVLAKRPAQSWPAPPRRR